VESGCILAKPQQCAFFRRVAGTGIVFRRVDLDNFELRADVGSVERVA
jgi:hypothetical protein